MYRGETQRAGFWRRTVVVSSTPSAACDGGAWNRPAAPANERVVRKRRRVCISGIGSPAYAGSTLSLCYRYERCRDNDFSYSCAALPPRCAADAGGPAENRAKFKVLDL